MVALCTFGFIGKKAVDFLYCPVVSTDDKAMVVHIQDEVLALRVERERGERGNHVWKWSMIATILLK